MFQECKFSEETFSGKVKFLLVLYVGSSQRTRSWNDYGLCWSV